MLRAVLRILKQCRILGPCSCLREVCRISRNSVCLGVYPFSPLRVFSPALAAPNVGLLAVVGIGDARRVEVFVFLGSWIWSEIGAGGDLQNGPGFGNHFDHVDGVVGGVCRFCNRLDASGGRGIEIETFWVTENGFREKRRIQTQPLFDVRLVHVYVYTIRTANLAFLRFKLFSENFC